MIIRFVVFDSKTNLYSSGSLHQPYTCKNIDLARVFTVEAFGKRSHEHYIRAYLNKEGVKAVWVREVIISRDGKKAYGEPKIL